MSTIKRFEDIEAWTLARELSNVIYPLTLKGSFERDFKLRDQINGSSGSAMDNIAEGFERDGTKEFRQMLSIAKGSAGEVRSQLYRALDRNHITKEEFNELFSKAELLSKKISKFIEYLNKTEFRGTKFS
jgi:four helix bundle protein